MKTLCLFLALVVPATAPVFAQTPAPAAPNITVIHAGELLDRPGQKPRGNASIFIENGKITDVRDGFAEPPAGARVLDL
ncbi:MAG TPA: hypothetical protein VF551_09985, partial [Chthoniobacterales bacterium]